MSVCSDVSAATFFRETSSRNPRYCEHMRHKRVVQYQDTTILVNILCTWFIFGIFSPFVQLFLSQAQQPLANCKDSAGQYKALWRNLV